MYVDTRQKSRRSKLDILLAAYNFDAVIPLPELSRPAVVYKACLKPIFLKRMLGNGLEVVCLMLCAS